MQLTASIDPVASDLKRVSAKMDEQNEFISLYINLMFFALMIYGNVMYYGKMDGPTK